MVAHDPGEWFEESLTSLAGQDYPNLSILVIDAIKVIPLPPYRVEPAFPD